VVVLIAALNKQVTTDELFGNGLLVFILTATLFLAAMLWRNREPLRMAPVTQAVPEMLRAVRPLLPVLGVGVAVIAFYRLVLGTRVNEHTAALVLPAVLLALVLFHRWGSGKLWTSLKTATSESSNHVGALLMLMVASVGLGGVVERAEVMSAVPSEFGSVWVTMAVLVLVMVLVGMTMDALGAVVLVSVSVASIAYDNGINPVHFWMMVLVAFELGYLTPPVAINHLLARQVIGPAARVEEQPFDGSWLERYEYVVVPMMVMGTALLLVAFVPLLWY
jgi:TRAP-type C4-dicarboxylate transport system permease large subunit